jgi:hypothetical protein
MSWGAIGKEVDAVLRVQIRYFNALLYHGHSALGYLRPHRILGALLPDGAPEIAPIEPRPSGRFYGKSGSRPGARELRGETENGKEIRESHEFPSFLDSD